MNRRAEGLPVSEKTDSKTEQKASSRKAVFIYVATLFIVVIFFIVLSYLNSSRNNTQIHTLHEKNVTAQQNIDELNAENMLLQEENDAYKAKLDELEQKINSMNSELKQTRKNWQADVQDVINSDQEKYNALLKQYNELIENNDIKVDSND